MITKELLRNELQDGLVHVTFTKKSTGQRRGMLCTTNATLIPQEHHPKPPIHEAVDVWELDKIEPMKEYDFDLFKVYDVDARGWRSFRYESLIEVDLEVRT